MHLGLVLAENTACFAEGLHKAWGWQPGSYPNPDTWHVRNVCLMRLTGIALAGLDMLQVIP